MMPIYANIHRDITNTLLATTFELRKHWRRKRTLIAFSLAAVLPLIFYVIPILFDTENVDTAIEFAANNLNFINLMIVISGAIFVGDAVSSEFENRTGLLLFPTPQHRSSIFIGKYLAALLSVFVVVAIYYLVTILEIAQLYGVSEITSELGRSFLMALLYSTSVISVIFFFSSFMKRAITSSLFGFFVLMMILPILSAVLKMVDVEPWFLVSYSSDLITTTLGLAQSGFSPGRNAMGNSTNFEPDFLTGNLIMFAYTIVFLIAGLFLANRRRLD